MKTVGVLIALATLASVSTDAKADGNSLLAACNGVIRSVDDGAKRDELSFGFCMGLMQGVVGTLRGVQIARPETKLVCLPDGQVSNGQAARIVVQYLKNHPAELQLDETILTVRALREVYPCREK